jgi:hypothetical protein
MKRLHKHTAPSLKTNIRLIIVRTYSLSTKSANDDVLTSKHVVTETSDFSKIVALMDVMCFDITEYITQQECFDIRRIQTESCTGNSKIMWDDAWQTLQSNLRELTNQACT